MFPEAFEATANRIVMPWNALGIAEESTLREFGDEPLTDRPAPIGEVHNALSLFALSFLLWEYPSRIGQVNVPGFNGQQFLGPGPSFPGNDQHVAKPLIGGEIGHLLIEVQGNDELSSASSGQIEVGNRARINVAHFHCPVESAFDGPGAPAFMTAGAVHGIQPVLNVEWSELVDIQPARDGRNEPLEAVTIELVRSRRPVALGPVEKQVTDSVNRVSSDPRWPGLAHQIVVTSEHRFAIRTEIDLTAVEGQVPDTARLAVPRLGKLRHG
jgi:hypothetical protein